MPFSLRQEGSKCVEWGGRQYLPGLAATLACTGIRIVSCRRRRRQHAAHNVGGADPLGPLDLLELARLPRGGVSVGSVREDPADVAHHVMGCRLN